MSVWSVPLPDGSTPRVRRLVPVAKATPSPMPARMTSRRGAVMISCSARHRFHDADTGANFAARGLHSVAMECEGQKVAHDQLGAVEQLRLAQRTALAGSGREVHEADVAPPVLASRPVKREIIKIIAEIGSRRAGGDGRKASRPQMPGELRSGNCCGGAEVGAI